MGAAKLFLVISDTGIKEAPSDGVFVVTLHVVDSFEWCGVGIAISAGHDTLGDGVSALAASNVSFDVFTEPVIPLGDAAAFDVGAVV